MKRMLYALPVLAACATTNNYVQRKAAQEERTEERALSDLERMTADGNFELIVAYVNNELAQHPDQYGHHMDTFAATALQNRPNAVYWLAIQQYQEDMVEAFLSIEHAAQQMPEQGFSYTYDLNYDE